MSPAPSRPDSPSSKQEHRARLARSVQTTALTGIGGRGLATVAAIFALPIVLQHLGPARFGIWLVITSSSALLSFADFGIGNGLVSAVAESEARDDHQQTAAIIGAAFVGSFILTAFLALFGWLVIRSVNWGDVLNASSGAARSDSEPSLLLFFLIFVARLPLGLTRRVLFGIHKGWIANTWIAVGAVAGTLSVCIGAIAGWSTAALVVCVAGPPLLADALCTIHCFGLFRPDLRPHIEAFGHRPAVAEMTRRSGLYLVLGLAGAIGYETDSLIISHYLGSRAAPVYGVPFQLFFLAPTAVGMVLAPTWAGYAHAIATGDAFWVRRTFQRSLSLSSLATIMASAALLATSKYWVPFWLGRSLHPGLLLLSSIAAWAVLNGVGGSLAMLMNGANVVFFQVCCACAMALSNLGLSVVLVGKIGIAGPVIASIVTQTACILVPGYFFVRKLLARLPNELS